MALHEPGWVCGSRTGSALRLLSRSVFEPLLGVRVSMTCPSVKASPSQWKRRADIRHSGLLLDLSVKISINQEQVTTLHSDLLESTKPLRRP